MKFIIQRTSEDPPGFEHSGLRQETSTNGYDYWTIELADLEELRDLFFEVGEVILRENYYIPFEQEIVGIIEIYDDYRE